MKSVAFRPERGHVLAKLAGVVACCAALGCASNAENDLPRAAGALNNELLSAIACAERHVAEQGYTDLPPNLDRVQESAFLSREDVARERRGTLIAHAHSVCPGKVIGDPGWMVIFKYRSSARGAQVYVSPSCKEVRAVHGDAPLFSAPHPESGCRPVPPRETTKD